MANERVVVDTNVFVSGALSSTSTAARCLERAIRQDQLVAPYATLRELAARLRSTRFDRYVALERRELLLQRLAPIIEVVEVLQELHVCRDPRDDIFLDAAVNGRATVLVTGDKDLLALHPFRGIAILTPSSYLKRP